MIQLAVCYIVVVVVMHLLGLNYMLGNVPAVNPELRVAVIQVLTGILAGAAYVGIEYLKGNLSIVTGLLKKLKDWVSPNG